MGIENCEAQPALPAAMHEPPYQISIRLAGIELANDFYGRLWFRPRA
jgi:hypothetical protein